jgi:hypothetical protein
MVKLTRARALWRDIDADGDTETATPKRALKEGSVEEKKSQARPLSFLQAAPLKAAPLKEVTNFLAVGELASRERGGENKISHMQSRVSAKVSPSYTKVVHPNASLVVSRMEWEPLEWLNRLGMLYELETEVPVRKDDISEGEIKPMSLGPHETIKPRAYNGDSSRECGGYLNFIVNEYYDLPSVAIFVHGQPLGNPGEDPEHGDSMHGDPHIFSVMHQIVANPSKVRSYCSLNKWPTVGSQNELAKQIENIDPVRFKNFIAGLKPLFSVEGAEGDLRCYSAAQFAVSRERIHSHPLSFYKEFLDWLREEGTARCRTLEGAWHRIFREPLVCPADADRCAFIYGDQP